MSATYPWFDEIVAMQHDCCELQEVMCWGRFCAVMPKEALTVELRAARQAEALGNVIDYINKAELC